MPSPSSKYQSSLSEITQRYSVWTVYGFGSRAREVLAAVEGKGRIDSNSASDIDIGVHYNKRFGPSVKEKVLLAQEFESLFNVPRVDLVDVGTADPFLALDIIRGEIIYCSSMYEQSEFELYVLRRAGDLACFERQRRELTLNK